MLAAAPTPAPATMAACARFPAVAAKRAAVFRGNHTPAAVAKQRAEGGAMEVPDCENSRRTMESLEEGGGLEDRTLALQHAPATLPTAVLRLVVSAGPVLRAVRTLALTWWSIFMSSLRCVRRTVPWVRSMVQFKM